MREQSPLSRLPNELFELVLRHADFQTIGALRTTSKANAARCMSPAFKQYYACQETDLSDASLTRLSLLSTHPQLAPAVTHLTITAVCYDPTMWEKIAHDAGVPLRPAIGSDGDVDEITAKIAPQATKLAERIAAWSQQPDDATATVLAQFLRSLPSLRSLRLHARVVECIPADKSHHDPWTRDRIQDSRSRCQVDWISLWANCGRVLDIVTQAMGRCESTSIQSVSVFDDCFGKPSLHKWHQACSTVLDPSSTLHTNFLAAAAKLTTLSLAFSPLTYNPDDLRSEIVGGRISLRPKLLTTMSHPVAINYSAIARFLKTAPHLEALTLYMYNTLRDFPITYNQVFEHIADYVRLPKLRELTLRGMWCTPDALLRFLRAHPDITALSFCSVHLIGPISTWDRIFEFLSRKMPHLSKLYLENLFYGGGKLLPLNPKDKQYCSSTDSSFKAKQSTQDDIIYAKHVKPTELKKGIQLAASSTMEPVSTRGVGGVRTMRWIKQRKIEYGPPRCPLVGKEYI